MHEKTASIHPTVALVLLGLVLLVYFGVYYQASIVGAPSIDYTDTVILADNNQYADILFLWVTESTSQQTFSGQVTVDFTMKSYTQTDRAGPEKDAATWDIQPDEDLPWLAYDSNIPVTLILDPDTGFARTVDGQIENLMIRCGKTKGPSWYVRSSNSYVNKVRPSCRIQGVVTCPAGHTSCKVMYGAGSVKFQALKIGTQCTNEQLGLCPANSQCQQNQCVAVATTTTSYTTTPSTSAGTIPPSSRSSTVASSSNIFTRIIDSITQFLRRIFT